MIFFFNFEVDEPFCDTSLSLGKMFMRRDNFNIVEGI